MTSQGNIRITLTPEQKEQVRKATGKDAGAVFMEAPQTGSPMTYLWKGKQYIIVAISGGPRAREAGDPAAPA